MKLMGLAFTINPLCWRIGWAMPVEDDGRPANEDEEGCRWFCLGPLALMFERP